MVLAVATFHAQARRAELVEFPQSDLDMIKVMQSIAPKHQQLAREGMSTGSAGVPFPISSLAAKRSAKKPVAKASKPADLTMPQQYARVTRLPCRPNSTDAQVDAKREPSFVFRE